jgi:hypothetical protein
MARIIKFFNPSLVIHVISIVLSVGVLIGVIGGTIAAVVIMTRSPGGKMTEI